MKSRSVLAELARKGEVDLASIGRPVQIVDSEREFQIELRPMTFERIYSKVAYKRTFNGRDPEKDDKLVLESVKMAGAKTFEGYAVLHGDPDILERRTSEVISQPTPGIRPAFTPPSVVLYSNRFEFWSDLGRKGILEFSESPPLRATSLKANLLEASFLKANFLKANLLEPKHFRGQPPQGQLPRGQPSA